MASPSSSSSLMSYNIIQNHDFSNGMDPWYTNCCDGFVVPGTSSSNRYAIISNRKQCWQGLEQDITNRVSPGLTYTLSAHVGVSGPHHHHHHHHNVVATIKLEYHGSETKYMFITRTSVSKDKWEKLEGTFKLADDKPDRVVFYIEGPDPGVDLLVESVLVSCATSQGTVERFISANDSNITLNPNFEDGVNKWSGRGCNIGAVYDSFIRPKYGNVFASATRRTQSWNGIQQDISGRVERKVAYNVIATVRIFGNNVTSAADIQATLWVQTSDSREQYIGISKVHATDQEWVELQGKFLLNGSSSSKVVIYLEGPPPGVDILVNGFAVKRAEKIQSSPPPPIENADYGVDIITNSNFRDGTKGWFPLGNCGLGVVKNSSPHLVPHAAREIPSGHSIHSTNRSHTWMGPAQIITDKVKLFVTYQVSAWVRLGSPGCGPQNVSVAIGVDDQWVNGGQIEINDDMWHEICVSFRIEKQPSKVMVYIQGPSPGINFMVAGFRIFAVDRRSRFKQLKEQTDKICKCDITLKF